MNALSDLKISQKLYALILVAMMALAGLAGMTQYQLGKVYDAANYATINTVPSFISIFEVQSRFLMIRIDSRDHALNTDDLKMVALDTAIQGEREAITKEMSYYEDKLISDPEDRRLLGVTRTALKDYYIGLDKMLSLSRLNKNAEAREQAEKNAENVAKVTHALQAHIDYNKKLAEAGSAEAFEIKNIASWTAALVTTIMLFVLVIFGWIIGKKALAIPIGIVVDNLKQLAEGRLDVTISGTQRRDEVGDIARAAQIFKEFVQKIETQGWIKAHTAEIASELQKADELKSLVQLAISRIAKLLSAGHGVIYVADGEGRLNLMASYGHRERKQLNNSLAIGEGLIGQCAMEKSAITLTAPRDYIMINSGLGEAAPNCIAVLPILHKDKLLGVLEIASFQTFTERETALLDALMPTLATSMEIIDRNQRTRELLTATQEQAVRMEKQAAQLEEQSVEMEAQQAELMETENWFRSIIETAPDGMLVVNETSTIVLSNPRAEALFGYEADQLIGVPLREILPSSISELPTGVDLPIQACHKDKHEMDVMLYISLLPALGKHGRCMSLVLHAA
ncbi:MAG: MCP four helix bundle domain-containing protein [Betaproteobacteria bacterium]